MIHPFCTFVYENHLLAEKKYMQIIFAWFRSMKNAGDFTAFHKIICWGTAYCLFY